MILAPAPYAVGRVRRPVRTSAAPREPEPVPRWRRTRAFLRWISTLLLVVFCIGIGFAFGMVSGSAREDIRSQFPKKSARVRYEAPAKAVIAEVGDRNFPENGFVSWRVQLAPSMPKYRVSVSDDSGERNRLLDFIPAGRPAGESFVTLAVRAGQAADVDLPIGPYDVVVRGFGPEDAYAPAGRKFDGKPLRIDLADADLRHPWRISFFKGGEVYSFGSAVKVLRKSNASESVERDSPGYDMALKGARSGADDQRGAGASATGGPGSSDQEPVMVIIEPTKPPTD